MPNYSSAQRTAIQQFTSFTQAKESIAGKYLKNNDWNVERAVNAIGALACQASSFLEQREEWRQEQEQQEQQKQEQRFQTHSLLSDIMAPKRKTKDQVTTPSAITPTRAKRQASDATPTSRKKRKRPETNQSKPAFFQGGETVHPVQQGREKVFDSYRDNISNEPDKIGIEGAQRYLTDLHLEIEDIAHFALCELLQCSSIGEFNREEFLAGWRTAAIPNNPCDTIQRQAQYVDSVIRPRLSSDPAYAKQVYRYAFKLAKPETQRSVPMDSAIEFWKLFYTKGKGGIQWNSSTTAWLDMWIEFYENEVKRPVNKDLWNMFGELVLKTKQPNGERLDWWTEDGAWPVAVDQFVALVRSKRHDNTMDTS